MRKNIVLLTGIAGLLMFAIATPTFADDDKGKDEKKHTIIGMGKCGKCALKETEKCQNVIQTEKGGKKTTYYLAKNDVSDKFHSKICQGEKKVKAVGTVKEVGEKKELTVSKIELVEDEGK
jgi:hypothetical protein